MFISHIDVPLSLSLSLPLSIKAKNISFGEDLNKVLVMC